MTGRGGGGGVPVQQHPGYHEGFWAAQALEPLFNDASPEYEAGWRGYWSCREILADMKAPRDGAGE